MAKTFYLKLGDCLNPVMSVLNSDSNHSIATNSIIKYNTGTHRLAIQQHEQAVLTKMSRIGTTNCRRLIIHSHGNGVGRLVVKGTNGNSRFVSAQQAVDFIIGGGLLGQPKYVSTVFVLACGIGNASPQLAVPFVRDFASRLAIAQNHGVTVFGSYYWVDLRYGSLFLYSGAHIDNVNQLAAENNVTNGTMSSTPHSITNVDNWVSYTSNFKKVVSNNTGVITSESADPA